MVLVKEAADAGVSDTLLFFVNGQRHEPSGVDPSTTLLEYIRGCGLTGTKLTCGEGGCGACTVMVSRFVDGKVTHRAVNACLAPLCSVDHTAVTTVEGLGSPQSLLHPIQKRIAEYHGSQCGFCTPGIVMATYAFLRTHPNPTAAEIEEQAGGNLCRCTGYRPILDAIKSFAGENNCCGRSGDGGGCCMDGGDAAQKEGSGKKCGAGLAADAGTAAADPLFPGLLRRSAPRELEIRGKRCTWYRPTTLQRLLMLRAVHGAAAKLVVGNTELGVAARILGARSSVLVAATHVPELQGLSVVGGSAEASLRIGASMTLTDLRDALRALDLPGYQMRLPAAILHQLHWFASNQIRNVACVGGNVVNASPISDLNPVFVAAGATMVLASAAGGERRVPAGQFFIAYRKVDLRDDEVLVAVEVPLPRDPNEFIVAYKQARRREDDISIVCAAVRARFVAGADGHTVADAGLGFGGMAARTVAAPRTAAFLAGKEWTQGTLDAALDPLGEDLPLPEGAPGGQVEYRRTLTTSFLLKFFLQTSAILAGATEAELAAEDPRAVADALARAGLDPSHATAIARAPRAESSGMQDLGLGDGLRRAAEPAGAATEKLGHVHEPVRHLAAALQSSGVAEYADDVAVAPRSLHAYPVLSKKAHARIVAIDASVAREMPGVVDVVTHREVPGDNTMGAIFRDEELFPSEVVTAHAQVIALVVAETAAQARDAAETGVRVELEELPAVLTIDDAIAADSFYEAFDHAIRRGDGGSGGVAATPAADTAGIDAALSRCANVLEGELRVGGQEHFYLEPNVTIATPGEDGEMTIVTSTQNPTKTQNFVASTLGVPANRVVCRARRLGGGFGGKETRSVYLSCAAAVAARRTGRTVRFVLDRHVDMAVTGTRHPFLARYRVGFADDGRVEALDVDLIANGGCSFDLSGPVVDRALFHSENAYSIPHYRARGRVARTNIPSNTAFRGFGGPQGMVVAEDWIDRVARRVGRPAHEVRRLNFYRAAAEGSTNTDVTPYGQSLGDGGAATLERCWRRALESSEFEARAAACAAFNATSRYVKRAVHAVPTKFGMSFTAKFMNQAGALVHVYTDGTVRASHGGVEMGQGLHTKMAQVVATELGVPLDRVHVACTGTDTVANTQPTAASVSADMNGAALVDACRQINERLAPVRAEIEKERAGGGAAPTLREVAQRAYFERVNLSANGFYKTPDVGYDFETAEGRPFNYYVYGVAVTEVEVDALTGDHTVLRSDVVMDLGRSLNPALDVGQIEGAFVQGLGLFTLEEITWLPSGALFTRGPGTYKIPSFNDVPIDFRVSLLDDSHNDRAIFSSKGVGEPPLHLAASAFFAIRDCVREARKDAGVEAWEDVVLHSPATSERIRMACVDPLARRGGAKESGEVHKAV